MDTTSTLPPEPTLSENLMHAWSDRGERAFDIMEHAMLAPALFKPEAVEAEMVKAQAAAGMSRYWRGLQVDDNARAAF